MYTALSTHRPIRTRYEIFIMQYVLTLNKTDGLTDRCFMKAESCQNCSTRDTLIPMIFSEHSNKYIVPRQGSVKRYLTWACTGSKRQIHDYSLYLDSSERMGIPPILIRLLSFANAKLLIVNILYQISSERINYRGCKLRI